MKNEKKSIRLGYSYLVNLTFLILFVRSFSDVLADLGTGFVRFNLSSALGMVFIVLLILLFFLEKFRNPTIGKNFLLWILFCLPFAISSMMNYDAEGLLGLREWIRLLSVFSVFLISYHLTRSVEDKKHLKYLFTIFFIPFFVSIHQLITQTGVTKYGVHRIYGTMSDPNNFSLLIIIFYALTWFFLVFSNKKILWGALIVLEELALVNTVSMTGYIMFFLVNFFFLINKSINRKKKYFLVFLVLIFVSLASYNKSCQIKFEKTMEETFNYEKPSNSLSWRVYNWKSLVSLWKQRPYFGYGLNSISIVNPVKTSAGVGYDSHNDYIKYLVETGIIGLMAYLLFLLYVLISLYKSYRTACSCEIKYLMYVLLVTFFVMQIGSLTCNYIGATFCQYSYWAICGISLKLFSLINISGRQNAVMIKNGITTNN